MKPLISIIPLILTGCVALADTTPYHSFCGIQFDPNIDQIKQAYICKISQLPQFKGKLAIVKHLPTDQPADHGFYRAMGTNDRKELYIYPISDKLNPQQLKETLTHEFGHLLWYEMERNNDSALVEFNRAWQMEGTMVKTSDIVDPQHTQSNNLEGFAEAIRFVVLQDSTADRCPSQKAIILKILARTY